jgi:hypothetical protein
LILSSSSIHLALPHLDPCCVGGRSRGRRKQWRAAARGRGRGGQGWGKGGLAAKKREKGRGRPLGFCGRKKRRLRCLLTLHPTAHNSFPHPRTKDQLLVNIFLGYYNGHHHTVLKTVLIREIVDYIIRLRRPYSSYNKSKCGKET